MGKKRRLLLLETPLNDTSAFSLVHETLFWLNSAMMVTESSGMLKLFCESSNKRGSSLPIVACSDVEPWFICVVMQPASPAVAHCEPVYPLVQTQEQISPLETLTPPFLHGVDFSHVDRSLAFSRGTTIRKMGMRTAAAMIIIITTQTTMNNHRGIPQQRR